MSILSLKQQVSLFFNTHWTATKIEWYGLPFDINGLTEWISISVEPTSSRSCGVSNDGYKHNAVINIEIFALKENRTFEIYDMISNILLNNNIDGVFVYMIDVDRKGLLKTTFGDFKILDIGVYLKSF